MNFRLIFLAFGFSNLAMLGWLAAAAAPLLIHLWSRHRFREAPWAAMQFLLAAMRKNARRMRLQQWLLLAVRTLLIVLVVLAVAEPYGEQLVAGSASGPTHKVLVLDASFSMAYREGDRSNFERAKKVAAALVRESRVGDTFTVVLMSTPARTVVDRNTVDHVTVAAQIESLVQPHAGADLSSTLALVEDAIAAEEKSRTGLSRHEVYFFTDLQRTTWQFSGSVAQRGRSDVNGRQSHVGQIAERAALVVIDLGQPRAANLAVTRFETPEPSVIVGRDITLEATLHHFSDQPHSQCTVELLVDDIPVAEQIVGVPASGEATVRFSHRFRAPGNHTVAVRAAADRLPIDNSRWLVVRVREEVRVLLVAGRDGAADYLARALNPSASASSAIRPIVVSEGDLADIELIDYECVFLCNVAQLTLAEAERLRNYAAHGGGVVFFLGDRVLANSYNQLATGAWGRALGEPPAEEATGGSLSLDPSHPVDVHPLIPARIGELVDRTQFGLDPLDYRHPVVAPFRGRERAGLLTTPATRYYQLETPLDRSGVEVVAATREGHPFIVAAPLGRGRTIVVATDGSLSSVDPTTGEPWTTWPTWPSFLPLVREMVAYATGGCHVQWQQQVGTMLGGVLEDVPPSAAVLSITRPDGRTAPLIAETASGAIHWTYSATDLSGVYTVRTASDEETNQYALNVDTTESDLVKVEPDTLPPQLMVRAGTQYTSTSRSSRVLTQAAWNEHLLWAALILLFAESLMAWQFGRGAA